MDTLINFIEQINSQIGIDIPKNWKTLSNLKISQKFLQGINQFFFQTYDDIGITSFQGEEFQYFSEFHKYWEEHHKEIINAKINLDKAKKLSIALNNAKKIYGDGLFTVTLDTCGLIPEAIAQVRFFTANQDFREPPKNQFNKYIEDPTIFDAEYVLNDPNGLIKFLGLTRLSQTDKRLDFAKNAAAFLVDKDITAFQLCEYFDNDAIQIRDALVNTRNIGYGLKKANMFLRDMVELNVWPDLDNFDEVDVASDINTMKIALRTGLLQTEMPLLSSFLDIFCFQISQIDIMNAMAWRKVWESWRMIDAGNSPKSPSIIDFLIYRIGREYCKDFLVGFKCDGGHEFFHFGRRLRKCRICSGKSREEVLPFVKLLPCQVNISDLPREGESILLESENLLHAFDGKCIFEFVCDPKSEDFRRLDPPKSISIKGQTGWTNSYAYLDRGGGGMMG